MAGERFRVVPAVYVYLLRPSVIAGTDVAEVLLQLRRRTGFRDGHWAAAVAGHVERGESVTAAALREAHEEAGLDRRRPGAVVRDAAHGSR